jgi:hypothetical protein
MDAIDRLSTDPAHEQRAAWAAALCGDLQVVDPAGPAEPGRDAVVCLGGITPELYLPLRRHAAAGVRLLLAVPNDDFDAMIVRLRAIGPGALLYQYAAEATLIAGDTVAEEDATVAALELTDRAEPPYAIWLLYAVNVPEGAWSAALSAPRVLATATPSPARRLAGLEAANRELWEANAALGRQLGELRTQLDGARPALSAGRLGGVPAGSALAALARDTEDAHAAHREKELEMWDEIQRLDTALQEHIAALQQVGAERDAANARHEVLRRRKAVRVALGLARLRPRRR